MFRLKQSQSLSIDVPEGFDLPAKTQWGYQPHIWKNPAEFEVNNTIMRGQIVSGTELGPLVTLHHDGENAAFTIQRPENGDAGLNFDFATFSGSFFSVAFALPEVGMQTLGRHDLLRISLNSATKTPFTAYVRLNLRYGPNTEQITRMIDIGSGQSFAEFDIFYTEFNPDRATSVWVDLIINEPENCNITLSEVTILRRARASL